MLDPTTTIGTGLFTTGETRVPVPLAGVLVEAEIHSFYAKVVVAHRYVNREPTPIEAVYVFPLDEGAAVCGFETVVDGTLVVGEVLEREKAFEMYDDAIEQGHGAFLLDEERPDVFQASIGNLPPGKEVLVKLTYMTELAVADRRIRFTIPTTVSPRYAPAEDCVGTGRPDSEALNPPVAWSVPYGLNLSLSIQMPGRISRIESPSHPVSITMNAHEATVSLGQQDAALDRDFVVSIDAEGLHTPQAIAEPDDQGGVAIGVAFAPAFETTSTPAEVIFVVDRSGSMDGASIQEVRNALQLCLRSMTPGCRFNIVGFGSTHESMFPASRAYDQASMQEASAYVATLEANLGGTELLPALRSVLMEERRSELPRQVVVLTDGEVTNTDAVIALASEHAADARIFTFAIGAGASHHLVRGLARAGGGAAEFIYPGERIEPKVLRQFARLLSPGLTDVRVDWSGGTVTQAPMKVPPVFAGGRLLVYGFVKDVRPTSARLSATTPSGPIAFEVPIPEPVTSPGRVIATLAARSRIRELEEGGAWLTGRGSRQKDRKENDARKEIVTLSTRYGLMSRETSFVAIEKRETPVHGDLKLRKVPVALTTGWGGLQGVSVGFPIAPPAARMASFRLTSEHLDLISGWDSAGATFNQSLLRMEAARPSVQRATPIREAPPARKRASASPAEMHTLAMLQAADGSWTMTQELASVLGRALDELKSAVAGATGDRDEVLRAWATALAVTWLQRHAADFSDEWSMLAAKARQWLNDTAAVPAGGWTWLDAGRQFLE